MRRFEYRWRRMMDRCYRENHSSYKWYGALGVTVCEAWRDYAGFEAWVLTQDHEGKDLDKDIINPDNKEYGPEFCRFVGKNVNRVLTDRSKLRGEFPLGVSLSSSGKYRAQINKNGNKIHLGSTTCPNEAHKLWQEAKVLHLLEVANSQTDVDVAKGLMARSVRIGVELANGVITEVV